MPKAKAEKKFVYCFVDTGKHKAPFLAELVGEHGNTANIRVDGKLLVANRDACSTVPYTQADLDKHVPPTQAPTGGQSAASWHPVLGPTVKKIQGFFS